MTSSSIRAVGTEGRCSAELRESHRTRCEPAHHQCDLQTGHRVEMPTVCTHLRCGRSCCQQVRDGDFAAGTLRIADKTNQYLYPHAWYSATDSQAIFDPGQVSILKSLGSSRFQRAVYDRQRAAKNRHLKPYILAIALRVEINQKRPFIPYEFLYTYRRRPRNLEPSLTPSHPLSMAPGMSSMFWLTEGGIGKERYSTQRLNVSPTHASRPVHANICKL